MWNIQDDMKGGLNYNRFIQCEYLRYGGGGMT